MYPFPRRLLQAAFLLAPCVMQAQLTTGIVEGNAQPGAQIVVTGSLGFRTLVTANADGEFSLALPWGEYRIGGVDVVVRALQTVRVDMPSDLRGYPGAMTLQGMLLVQEPSSVTEPLDFTGLKDNEVGVESQHGYSWTDTQYKLLGMDATDSYQPGRPMILPDLDAVDDVVVRSDFAQTASTSHGTEVGIFLKQPGEKWHASFATADSAGFLSSSNLPPPAERGMVQQADRFHWFTRDGIDAGGPVTKRFDLYIRGAAQWSSQTVPLAPAGNNQRSRLLLGDIRGRIQATARDQIDALYNGSRINLNNWGVPVGLDPLVGRPNSPSLDLPGGFSGESGIDHFDFLQVGWTHRFRDGSPFGVLQVRYGDSTAHIATDPPPEVFGVLEPKIELLTGAVTGAPPISTLAVRTRQGVAGVWQPAALRVVGTRHQIVVGTGWKTSSPLNRTTIPSDINLLTLNGAPSEVVEFNTPIDAQSNIRSIESYAADHIRLTGGLSLDLGILGDFSRGSLASQSKGNGQFVSATSYVAQPDLIAWNSVSPRAGFAWQIPGFRRMVLRGAWSRLYSPLAGRYLDFGNPGSLSGNVYEWTQANADGKFSLGEEGPLLSRFGGAYSSISPSLQRPYADEFNIGAEAAIAPRSFASFQAFRRDDKDRIAAIDTGVPASAFSPVTILDPGPDGVAGTSDDQHLVVYAQNPATLGKDQYLLTNPPGLSDRNMGFMARAGTQWSGLVLQLSFVAEKTTGPTNPGNALFENDPGVVGALYMDPNTLVNANGRSFTDRAYVGKMLASYRFPKAWGGFEVASTFTYLDGLLFNRQLLVTGLPQGPFFVAAGDNRAQHVGDLNFRILRQFQLRFGRIAASTDILNATNAGRSIQENEITGPSFNLRLPTEIQEPRLVRLQVRYEF